MIWDWLLVVAVFELAEPEVVVLEIVLQSVQPGLETEAVGVQVEQVDLTEPKCLVAHVASDQVFLNPMAASSHKFDLQSKNL